MIIIKLQIIKIHINKEIKIINNKIYMKKKKNSKIFINNNIIKRKKENNIMSKIYMK